MNDQDRDEAPGADLGEQGRAVAATAADQASNVAEAAKTQVQQIQQEATAQGRALVDEAKNQLRQQGDGQLRHLAEGAHRASEQARALAEGRPEAAGPMPGYASRAADQLTGFAERVDTGGLDGIVDELQRFARRRPGVFLLGAAVAGFATGRLLRGASAATDSATVGRPQPGSTVGRDAYGGS